MLILILLFLQVHFWKCEAGMALPRPGMENYSLIGGETINITEAPHTVTIWYQGVYYCTGALIAADVVVTTIFCMTALYNYEAKPEFLKVRAGSSYADMDGVLVKVRKVMLHPDENRTRDDYNLGLLWLEKPLNLSDKIAVIEMMKQGEELDENASVQVTGFGYIGKGGGMLKIIQQIHAKNKSECDEFIGLPVTTPRMICAGNEHGREGFCDSQSIGAPLVYNNTLAGLALYPLSGCILPLARAQIYTKVSSMRNWIDEAMENNKHS